MTIYNPYKIERVRQELAQENDISALRQTYKDEVASVRPKPASFWDEKVKGSLFAPQGPMDRERLSVAINMIPKVASVKVLDVGAGYGFLETELSTIKHIEIYGIDISWVAINRLRKKFKGYFTTGSAISLPYTKASFDVVFLLEVVEHLSPRDSLKAIKEAHRVLGDSGVLIVSIPLNEDIGSFRELKNNPSGHLRIYSEALILKELEMCGFKPLRAVRLYAFRNLYKLKRFLIRFLPGYRRPNDLVILARKI
ncbi:class I SAM-dependent methyltransferase [Candidatus Shapirobacteria bacterium]|nr:class I SAM-dependent methyltransferase [Candidatus Shapirobacteria bacterium]